MESYRREEEEIYSGPIAPVGNTEGAGSISGSLPLTNFRLYYSNQNGSGTKRDTQTNGTEQRARNKSRNIGSTNPRHRRQ